MQAYVPAAGRAVSAPKSPAGAARLDPLQVVEASFVAAAGPGGPGAAAGLPAPATVEVAFAGRSNVGKSSLINTLVDRRGLVRTSGTPGSTRQINLFAARARDGAVFHLVDLPGYGFTRRSKAERAAWAELIEGYLRDRVTLAAVVLLVDVRRGLEPDDRALIDFIEQADRSASGRRRPVEVIVVATKLDKVARSVQRRALAEVAAQIELRSGGTSDAPRRPRSVIGFSSVTGDGKRALWQTIRRIVLAEDG